MGKLSAAQVDEARQLCEQGWTTDEAGAHFGVTGAAIRYRLGPRGPKDPEQRFWNKVDRSAGQDACWLWMGSTYPSGYGQFRIGGTGSPRISAHRMSLIYSGIKIPEGAVVHHECRIRLCVNPRHLSLLPSTNEHTRLHTLVWTKERILAAFFECYREIGCLPRAIDFNPALAESRGEMEVAKRFREHDWPHINSIRRAFGNWSDLVLAAGLIPRTQGTRPVYRLSA